MCSRLDLVLHPVRMRIVQTIGTHERTATAVAREMGDVPLPSLYRHLRRLADAGILKVVKEERVRGAVRRTYALDVRAAHLSADELARLTAEGHRRLFMGFLATVIDGFERYLAGGPPDFVQDGVSYSQATAYLTDDEAREVGRDLQAVIERALALPPGAGRRARTLSTVLVSAREEGEPEGKDGFHTP